MKKNRKPILVLVATGTSGGKGTFISKIKKNQLFSADKKICHIGIDNYVTIHITEKESKIGKITYGFGGAGWMGGTPGKNSLDNRIKEEYNKNLLVHLKVDHDFAWPKSVNFEALKEKIDNELSEHNPNKVVIVEGVHALQFKDIRKIADLKIWIETDIDLRLIRKITRSPYYKKIVGKTTDDPRNFGILSDPFPSAFKCWEKGVKPGEKLHVIPTKKYADLVIFNNNLKELNHGITKVIKIINLYFENKEKFKRKLMEDKKQRIEKEVSELEQQIKEKITELS